MARFLGRRTLAWAGVLLALAAGAAAWRWLPGRILQYRSDRAVEEAEITVDSVRRPLAGEVPPDFGAFAFNRTPKQRVRLGELRGSPVLIWFFATW